MMMLRYAALGILAAAFLLTSCAPTPAPDTRAADESAIRALDEQWSATAARNDLDGTVAFYSDDAVLLAPNAPIATDKKSIRDSWGGLLGPNTAVSWKVSKVEVAEAGELGRGAVRMSGHDRGTVSWLPWRWKPATSICAPTP